MTGTYSLNSPKQRTNRERQILSKSVCFEYAERLAYIADHIHEQPEVRIKYFVPDERKSGGAIVEIFGKVKKISDTDGTIVMADGCKIRLSGITDLSIG